MRASSGTLRFHSLEVWVAIVMEARVHFRGAVGAGGGHAVRFVLSSMVVVVVALKRIQIHAADDAAAETKSKLTMENYN